MGNVIFQEKENLLQVEELGKEVLENSGNELLLRMRFLGRALASLKPAADRSLHPAGTDGRILAYHPEELLALFRTDHRLVNRLTMHTLIHCLFGHLFLKEDPFLHLACDMTAEFLLDELYLPCLHRSKSSLRLMTWRWLRDEMKVVTAQGVLRALKARDPSEEELMKLTEEFRVDDHRLWHRLPPRQQQMLQKQWKDMSGKTLTAMEAFSKEATEDTGSLHDHLSVENRRRYDYREFLRKFSVLKEEVQVDPDSFDPVYYQYGLDLYGNLPLIEPLETREVNRIEEFVIVLDTSMSCKGELIRHFLEETFSILSERDSFFRQVRIRLIQCDERIQKDTLITGREDLEAYLTDFEILGCGGTDFRPPFAYVNSLVARGSFHKLKGLIYFTDGYGTFPVKKPVYDTVFVFMKDDYQDADVPPWAMKVILDPAWWDRETKEVI